MPALRHVLTDNHWEMQCPVCGRFVPIDRAAFIGEARFPPHQSRIHLKQPCGFRPSVNWLEMQWQATGLTSFGPIE